MSGVYPEHEKLSAVADQSQAVGEFLDWAGMEHGLHLCEGSTGQYVPTSTSMHDLLAEHFGIDRNKLEDEKRHMLALIQRETP